MSIIARINKQSVNFNILKNTKALSYTLIIHLVLLLIFFFVKYNSVALPLPPANDLIELETVALGVDENGFGIEPPEMVVGLPAPADLAQGDAGTVGGGEEMANHADVPAEDDDHDDVATVEHPTAAPVIKRAGNPTNPKPPTPTKNKVVAAKKPTTTNNTNTNKTQAKTTNTNTSTSTSTAAQQQAKYTFPGATGSGGNGADQNAAGARNRGDGTGNGMKGKVGGDPNSVNFSGGITGRTIVTRPSPQAEFRDGGKVEIKVWVNRDGKIIRHEIQRASNSTIRAIAEQKIKGVTFNKSKEARVEQSGILVFNFRAGTGK